MLERESKQIGLLLHGKSRGGTRNGNGLQTYHLAHHTTFGISSDHKPASLATDD